MSPDTTTVVARGLAISFALIAAFGACLLVIDADRQNGFQIWDILRAALILLTTCWLAWGAALGLMGLYPKGRKSAAPLEGRSSSKTVVLVPICNEDPIATFARIAAMDASIRDMGLNLDIAVLSDTRAPEKQAAEHSAFRRLMAETHADGRHNAGQIFYRNREDNRGRKAGNVEDFIVKSGGAYDYAVTLDADSLMTGAALNTMILRMDADERLGLLQTLPKITGAQSFFARAMQFAAAFHGPIFTKGLERMQGSVGPYWGHNAIIRITAFAQSCRLPELEGKAPFGGHILSHDYVEAALLARNGWRVVADHSIDGSYEEGPENVLAYAKRDRRWCQGNLQHSRLVFAPGLANWSRLVFVQGITAYLVSLFWAVFLVTTVAGAIFAPEPNYFPEPNQLFPVFPSDRSREIFALALGIIGLLILPKVAIYLNALKTNRSRDFGGNARALLSVLAEILLTSLLAPIMLAYQTRAVIQVLSRQDGGWPANARGEGRLTFAQAARSSLWIVLIGALSLIAIWYLAPNLMIWLLPVTVPMICAPALISWSSQPTSARHFTVPEDMTLPPVVRDFREIHAKWCATPPAPQPVEKATHAPA
ncbi:membrane glycosyltransferase [Pacificibacter maritimus]|uniref:Glucans biosynthesis glucosyltransferase H n=1 Tax=Pacificibacter maritimus TaxID=762213 RepID=A0A3N4VE40_9RHOB|nr:glucans biosynthesis glucosyltransferase MdoH [Pacificibacter maritimus]RPE72120.1 membrane glycosyltransferase [Pacificibacter maritimus]